MFERCKSYFIWTCEGVLTCRHVKHIRLACLLASLMYISLWSSDLFITSLFLRVQTSCSITKLLRTACCQRSNLLKSSNMLRVLSQVHSMVGLNLSLLKQKILLLLILEGQVIHMWGYSMEAWRREQRYVVWFMPCCCFCWML